MVRRLLVQKIKEIFQFAKQEPLFIRAMDAHFIIRYIVGGIFVVFGIVGMITPIPAGFVFVVIGISLITGIARTKSNIIRFIHFTRLHILYGKVYLWWKRR